MVRLIWLEAGGPPVKPPRKTGYGAIFLRRVLSAVGGSVVTDFAPTGLRASVSVPIRARAS
jgi:two-component system CheB/CheR fusion protein